MNKKFSKVFAVLLAVCMLLSHILVPVTADSIGDPTGQNEPAGQTNEIEVPEGQCYLHTNDERAQFVDADHWLDFVEPTCTDWGYDEYLCDLCGGWFPVIIYDDPDYQPHGHVLGDFYEEVPATCTEDGKVAYCQCSVCERFFDATFQDLADANVYVIVEDDAGERQLTTIVEAQEVNINTVFAVEEDLIIPALGHDMDEGVVTAPTCTEPGYTTYTCQRDGCDYSYDDDETDIDPDAHPAESVELVEEVDDMTCGGEGQRKTYHCNDCDATWDEDVVEAHALPHEYDITVEQEATCTEPALWRYICRNCGLDVVLESPEGALGHNFDVDGDGEDDWFEEEATCTEDGVLGHYHCVRCELNFDEDGNVWVIEEEDPYTMTQEELDATAEPTFATEDDLVIEALSHDWDDGVETPATCVAQGFTTYTCQREGCDESYVDPDSYTDIDPNAHHEYNSIARVPATCTQEGISEEVRCDLCGALLASQRPLPIDPNNHVDSEGNSTLVQVEAAEPNCTEGGHSSYEYCTACGYEEQHEVFPANNHTPLDAVVENEVPATCTEVGSHDEVVYCDVCGEELSRETVEDEALGHNFDIDDDDEEDWIEEDATCTEDGIIGHYHCVRCELNFDEDGNVWVIDEEDGLYTVSEDELEDLVPATEEDLVIPAGHDWQYLGTIEPTCTEGGYDIWQCQRCRDPQTGLLTTERNNFTDPRGHNYEAVVTEPTCTEGGYTTYTCQRVGCGDTYTGDETDPLGHDYDAVVTDPTCTEGGFTTYTCQREGCGDTYTGDETDPLGHDFEWNEEVPATCTEDGVAGHYECSRCGLLLDENEEEVEEDDLVIPAPGHDLDDGVVTPATCTEGGYTTYTCQREGCDYSETGDETEALGHLPGEPEIDNVVEPTYDAPGSYDEVIRCERCGEILESEEGIEVPPLNEGIYFSYEATGIKGSTVAVNSGYVFVKVYMNVYTDIARFYGVDFALDFDEPLTLIAVTGCVFENGVTEYTGLDKANNDRRVILAQNMGAGFEQATFEEGSYLYATLVFKVADHYCVEDGIDDYYTTWVDYAYDYEPTVGRYGFVNEIDVSYQEGVEINVEMLGDADFIIRKLADPEVGYGEYNDGRFTTIDAMALALWFANAEDEDAYETIFDMNKDGFIDGDDFVLLHTAIAGNYDYLELCGDYRDLI